MKTIIWKKSMVSENWWTVKYGNLLSDTYQGNVYPNSNNKWSGWLLNHSAHEKLDTNQRSH